MSERRHSVYIGAFVVGALFIALAAVLFFTGAGFTGARERVIMAFDGSVKGLAVGAPVALRGVQIGQVTDIQLQLSADRAEITMLVEAELDEGNIQVDGQPLDTDRLLGYLIDNGLRAQLNMQSVLTGLLYVQMDFHPDTPAKLAELDSGYTQVPTIPTELEMLRRTLQTIDYGEMAEAMQAIAGSLRAFVENEDFDALPGELRGALGALEQAGTRLDSTLEELQPSLAQALDDVGSVASELRDSLPGVRDELTAAAAGLDSALAETREAMGALGDRAAAESPTVLQLRSTLREMSRASRALQNFVQTLEDQPDALLRGRREREE